MFSIRNVAKLLCWVRRGWTLGLILLCLQGCCCPRPYQQIYIIAADKVSQKKEMALGEEEKIFVKDQVKVP